MTGDLVKAMRNCPQPIIAAVDGVCAGAGAILAMASDLRLATPEAKTAFLFTRVGLAGADMGACGILPRIIGQGRAAELLFTGRAMSAAEGSAWGFYNALHPRRRLEREALALARSLADGPWFAHGMTKTMLNQEWAMGLDRTHRGRGAGAGDLHGDAAISAAPSKPSPPSANRCSRATDALPAPRSCARLARLAVLRAAPSRLARAARRVRRFARLRRRSTTATSTAPAASWCASLGDAGLLDAAVAPPDGDARAIDSRSACLARETLAWHDGLADFAFAMQGLGSGADRPRRLAGTEARRAAEDRARANGSPPSRCPRRKPAPTSPR